MTVVRVQTAWSAPASAAASASLRRFGSSRGVEQNPLVGKMGPSGHRGGEVWRVPRVSGYSARLIIDFGIALRAVLRFGESALEVMPPHELETF
jgi:hypothetical protein